MANRLSPSALDSEDVPFTGHAFQWLNTAIDETKTGACDQVFHRARDQHPSPAPASAAIRAPISQAIEAEVAT
jgi:hypothetical protein